MQLIKTLLLPITLLLGTKVLANSFDDDEFTLSARDLYEDDHFDLHARDDHVHLAARSAYELGFSHGVVEARSLGKRALCTYCGKANVNPITNVCPACGHSKGFKEFGDTVTKSSKSKSRGRHG